MKKQVCKKMFYLLALLLVLCSSLGGCNKASSENSNEDGTNSLGVKEIDTSALSVRFGDEGEEFIMHLYENDTAKAIANHIGTADWRLPIYNFDNFENWQVMQYYDIPNSYKIPSSPQLITEEKAGEVYYFEPNRIVLFYGEANVSNEYTPLGYFDFTEEFVTAVTQNPTLEGWENKIINISPRE